MTREKQLKQEIERYFPVSETIKAQISGLYGIQSAERTGAEKAISLPSILRHADPEIMKQAGWVREEEQPFKGFTVADMKRAMEFAAIKGWNLELGVSAKFRERGKMIENYIKSIIVTT